MAASGMQRGATWILPFAAALALVSGLRAAGMLEPTARPARVALSWSAAGGSAGAPAAGRFLVAARTLRDPNFVETVILLVDFGDEGATGVIINRPTEIPLAGVLPEVSGLKDREDKVWQGGPVASWQLVLLTRSAEAGEGSRRVLSDVYFSTSRLLLERLVEESQEFRVYAGYAGWSPGQLEGEIARGGWSVLPGDPEMVFDPHPFSLWRELLERSSGKWALRAPQAR